MADLGTPMKFSRVSPTIFALATFGAPFVTPTYAGEDTFVNKKNRYGLIIVNLHASNSFTVTAAAQTSYAGIALPDESLAVAAESCAFFGPFDENFMDADKLVHLTYAGTTPSAKICLVEITENDA